LRSLEDVEVVEDDFSAAPFQNVIAEQHAVEQLVRSLPANHVESGCDRLQSSVSSSQLASRAEGG
jgi:hypothetical protein